MTSKRIVPLIAASFLLGLQALPAFAAHPKDRPRDPKATWIYHTYLSDRLIDKRGEEIIAYTLVKGGDGPFEIRADLMRHEKVMRSWDWQSDPNIVITSDLPDLPNGLYYLRVSARDGKTGWTEDSAQITINRPDLNAVPVTGQAALGSPIRFDIYMCGVRETSRLFIQVQCARTGRLIAEEQTTFDALEGREYAWVPQEPGIYRIQVEARPTYKTSYFVTSEPVVVTNAPNIRITKIPAERAEMN